MLNVLFPHANPEDMRFFTNEMQAAEPKKFKIVWEALSDNYKQAIRDYSQSSPMLAKIIHQFHA